MSALTEKVGRTHYAATIEPRYVLCRCDEEFSSRIYHAEHVAEVTAAEVAAEIRAAVDSIRRDILATYDDLAAKAYLDAYIAEGKTRAVSEITTERSS